MPCGWNSLMPFTILDDGQYPHAASLHSLWIYGWLPACTEGHGSENGPVRAPTKGSGPHPDWGEIRTTPLGNGGALAGRTPGAV